MKLEGGRYRVVFERGGKVLSLKSDNLMPMPVDILGAFNAQTDVDKAVVEDMVPPITSMHHSVDEDTGMVTMGFSIDLNSLLGPNERE